MMKYQQVSYNFVPKAEDLETEKKITEDLKAEKKITDEIMEEQAEQLKDDNNNLLNELEELRVQVDFAKKQLETKEFELVSANNKLNELESQMGRYEAYKEDVEYIDALNIKLESLTKEREDLVMQLQQRQDHIQTLYMIMLVLVFI